MKKYIGAVTRYSSKKKNYSEQFLPVYKCGTPRGLASWIFYYFITIIIVIVITAGRLYKGGRPSSGELRERKGVGGNIEGHQSAYTLTIVIITFAY